MSRFDELFEKKKIVILDGAMATELEKKGCNLNDDLWSAKVLVEHPELIEQVHYDYFKAGADIGTSASYQATVEGFVKKGYSEEEAEKLIADSVKLLIKARDRWWNDEGKELGRAYPLVAAAVGPYGAYLADGSEYRGFYNISKEELKEFHKKRLEILKNAGAEIFAVETVPCLYEAEAVAELLEEMECDYWISFSCRNESKISDGTSIEACAESLNKFSHLKAVGLNCTAPKYVEHLIKSIKTKTEKPVIVYPNSGEDYDPGKKIWLGTKYGKNYGSYVREWYAAGAQVIGGCCRTAPKDINDIYKFEQELV